MNDMVGNILQNTFYACCYILLSGTRPKRQCTPICGTTFGATGGETSLLWTASCTQQSLPYPRCRWAFNS